MREISKAWLPSEEEEKSILRDCRFGLDASMPPESYRIEGGAITGADEAGLMYGKFAYMRSVRLGGKPADEYSAPAARSRVLNHWDDVSGKAERGYAGGSLFFRDGRTCYDPERLRRYARLLASVGINRICCNNVNVSRQASKLITEELLPEVARMAEIFREYHIKLVISVDFASPQVVGGLSTYDPLDGSVIAWWAERAAEVFRHIPDLAGFLVKADSEFRAGPAALGRTQADGANVIARALAPFGGMVYWRCFVYDCMQDWRDAKTDRPMAAYKHFKPLDGSFDRNVVLQVKNGPSDFQVREPLSPLLGAMEKTREALEFQVTQEYTGQQIDLYNLAVAWEEVFALEVSPGRRLSDCVGNEIDSVCAVSNVGLDPNWTGHDLAQANLYAFGRLAWNPRLTAGEITGEWVGLTFGKPLPELFEMMMASRAVYEKYNAPLGLGWMVNISHHYGPSPEGYEFMKWGTYHRASRSAIGVDRTKNGTGYTSQYHPSVAAVYDDPASCPEEYLLYFHRLPYDYRLKSGKTLLQHVYDTHFEGAEDVEGFIRTWESLRDELPADVYENVRERLDRQLLNAREWRDVVNTYFFRLTGIPDERGRRIYD